LGEEKYILCKHINMSMADANEMTVYERRMQLDILTKDVEEQKKRMEENKSNNRPTKIWGKR
jgi:hypothetical protein